MSDWNKAQSWELSWHSNCINSFHEEEKQLVYAEKMGLVRKPTPKTPYNFDLGGKSILDIGGGAYSLLLKCVNYGQVCVVDPLMNKFPQWVRDRYDFAEIEAIEGTGEMNPKAWTHTKYLYDEVWIYNVLEHTFDPKNVIKHAKELGNIIRIFEWIDTPTNIGHISSLTEKDLNTWLGGEGKVELIRRGGAVGRCYYGIFKGDHYASLRS